MVRSILDTDILSEIGKGIDESVARNASAYLDVFFELTFTSVSVYEVLYGLKAKPAPKQAASFLDLIADHEEIVPSAEDYRTAADIRAAMHRGGTEIGKADPVIAACAMSRNLPLVTGNMRHYGYIRDAGFPLTIHNWRDSDG